VDAYIGKVELLAISDTNITEISGLKVLDFAWQMFGRK
jgi:hypothetical protein